MNDEVEMQTVEERIPTLEEKKMFRWPRFLLDRPPLRQRL